MSTDKRKTKHSTRTRPVDEQLSAADIRFCQALAQGKTQTEAYRQADFPNSKSNDNAVARAASRHVRKCKIRKYLRELKQQAADAAGVTVDMLAQGFRRVGFADRRGVFGPDGCMLPPEFWPEELGSIIAGIEVEDLEEWDEQQQRRVKIGRKWKVRFERSMEARKILAQWKGMIGQDAEGVTGRDHRLVVGGEADPEKL